MSKSSTTTKAIATPNRVTAHPGEVLNEEFLKPLGMSINALAIALRVPATRIGAIVKGERSVTADTALRLARFFDTSPEFWMNLQAMHDLTKTRIENGARAMFDRGLPKSGKPLTPHRSSSNRCPLTGGISVVEVGCRATMTPFEA
jgi:addiction module HigA family antidote